jgi:hypothetical protein
VVVGESTNSTAIAKSPINVNTSKRNSACRRSGAASTLLVEKTGDGEESFLVALADCCAPPSFFKSLLHTPVRTTASSCSLLGIPSTHSDLLLYSILFCPIQLLLSYHRPQSHPLSNTCLSTQPTLFPSTSAPLHTTVSNNTRLPHRTTSKVNTSNTPTLHKTREPIPTAWMSPRHDW